MIDFMMGIYTPNSDLDRILYNKVKDRIYPSSWQGFYVPAICASLPLFGSSPLGFIGSFTFSDARRDRASGGSGHADACGNRQTFLYHESA